MTRYSLLNRISLSLFAKIIIIFSLFSTFNLHAAEATKHSVSGVIKFIGMIVEGPCEDHFENNVMEMSCWNHGKTTIVKTSPVSFNGDTISLPDFKGTMKFQWIDNAKKLGIYKINYN